MTILRAMTMLLCLCSACDKPAPPPPPSAPAPAPAVEMPAPEVRPDPWSVPGTLVGTTATHAVVLGDGLLSVEIETGVVTRAATAAEDPAPNFDRLLPRLGDDARTTVEVDRLANRRTYVGGDVVVFLRGTEDAATSLVGLSVPTLEEAWVLELAYRRPVRTCGTAAGVLVLPQPDEPVRFVDWTGKQRWLRELGTPGEELIGFACGDDRIVAHLKSPRGERVRTFAADTGDLVMESAEIPSDLAASVTRTTAIDPRVRQVGEFVEGEP